jgi:hypothetical protein
MRGLLLPGGCVLRYKQGSFDGTCFYYFQANDGMLVPLYCRVLDDQQLFLIGDGLC